MDVVTEAFGSMGEYGERLSSPTLRRFQNVQPKIGTWNFCWFRVSAEKGYKAVKLDYWQNDECGVWIWLE